MKVVIQRVTECSLGIAGKEYSRIEQGLLVLLGIEDSDTREDISWLCQKIINLRIFDDKQGVMNLSVADSRGEVMVVSQFTLHASTRKGNRPSYIRAAKPEIAVPLYEGFVSCMKSDFSGKVATGVFGANMQIALVNDGPVTIIIDSKSRE